MKRITKLLGVLGLGLGLVACSPQRTEDPEYFAAQQQAAASQDALVVGRFADEAQQRYRAGKDARYRDEAIDAYRRFLQLSPGHLGASVALYQLYGERLLEVGGRADLAAIRGLFADNPAIAQSDGIAPPSLIEVMLILRHPSGADVATVRSLLRDAIRENPNEVRSTLILARLYLDEGRDALAKSLYQQVLKRQPDNPQVLKLYAGLLFSEAQSSHCDPDREMHRRKVRAALDAAKTALRQQPQDAELVHDMSILYESLDRRSLALFLAQRHVELEPTIDARRFLIDQYLAAFQFDTASAMVAESQRQVDQSQPIDFDQIAEAAYLRGDWAAAREALTRYRRLGRPRVYELIDEMALAAKLGQAEVLQEARASLDPSSVEDPWQAQLLRFALGHIDEQGLMAMADNACRRAEGEYALARKAWFAGDRNKAAAHYRRVVDAGIPRFVEHVRAKFRLEQLSKG